MKDDLDKGQQKLLIDLKLLIKKSIWSGKTLDSTDTITKMYVSDIESKYSSTGLISIADAVNNPIKDNFYYL